MFMTWGCRVQQPNIARPSAQHLCVMLWKPTLATDTSMSSIICVTGRGEVFHDWQVHFLHDRLQIFAEPIAESASTFTNVRQRSHTTSDKLYRVVLLCSVSNGEWISDRVKCKIMQFAWINFVIPVIPGNSSYKMIRNKCELVYVINAINLKS